MARPRAAGTRSKLIRPAYPRRAPARPFRRSPRGGTFGAAPLVRRGAPPVLCRRSRVPAEDALGDSLRELRAELTAEGSVRLYDRLGILSLIQGAEQESRFCACGARMIVVERDGAIWLDCAARPGPRSGFLSRLASIDWISGHDRRLILDEAELLAA